jgi:hypothetical protein
MNKENFDAKYNNLIELLIKLINEAHKKNDASVFHDAAYGLVLLSRLNYWNLDKQIPAIRRATVDSMIDLGGKVSLEINGFLDQFTFK